ncbi:nucleotidyltransferase domain-containing protein [Litorilinea aerophila]|nr:nucleotidyltransferase domain-containing protein [Litorilinea aerophila]MCC9076135.1 nucleotidyltransferase domain-containing protein [Litorilinea aerophila]GIV78834.1 MAG: DNA polymerase beta-like region [Litorilinea sp.]
MGETEDRLQALVTYFQGQPDVRLIYLFGSHARQQARQQSDLDIAILLDERDRTPFELLERRLDLTARAAEIVRGPVDVVLLNRASLLLQGQVLKEGRLLYAADKATQVEYEARARALYFDFLPRLRQHREALLKAAREGKLGRSN